VGGRAKSKQNKTCAQNGVDEHSSLLGYKSISTAVVRPLSWSRSSPERLVAVYKSTCVRRLEALRNEIGQTDKNCMLSCFVLVQTDRRIIRKFCFQYRSMILYILN
jgi:hypothetical protein